MMRPSAEKLTPQVTLRTGLLPELPALRVEGAEIKFGAEHEAGPVAADGERARVSYCSSAIGLPANVG